MSGGLRTVHGAVEVGVSPEVACAYFADPYLRPRWQSSLRRVEAVDPGEPHVGQTWRDVTLVGMVPQMRTVDLTPGASWAEEGTWRGVRARLDLRFVPREGGCTVHVHFRISGPGPLRPLGWAASVAARPAVLADVRRAARLLEAAA